MSLADIRSLWRGRGLLTVHERVCNFGPEKALLGIMTDPDAATQDANLPAIILLNAGLLHHVGQNRLNVTIARRMATSGFLSLRFDFSGLGDSATQTSSMPVRERNVAEIQEAMDFLESTRGIQQFVLVGLCTGADNAHRAAVADARVCGTIMLDGYSYPTVEYFIRRFKNKLFSPTHWKNFLAHRFSSKVKDLRAPPEEAAEAKSYFWILPRKSQLARELRQLVQRDVNMLQIFSGSNIAYNHKDQYESSFRNIDFRDLLTVLYIEQADHTYSIIKDRAFLISRISDWLSTGYVQSGGTTSVSGGENG